MNTFTWLLLGHLIGDWMLQNDWMAKNKQNRLVTLAGMTHFAVYTICIVGTLLLVVDSPLSTTDYLSFSVLLFVSHWLIDATNFAYIWGQLVQQSDVLMVRVAVDQSLHLIVLGLLIEYFL